MLIGFIVLTLVVLGVFNAVFWELLEREQRIFDADAHRLHLVAKRVGPVAAQGGPRR